VRVNRVIDDVQYELRNHVQQRHLLEDMSTTLQDPVGKIQLVYVSMWCV